MSFFSKSSRNKHRGNPNHGSDYYKSRHKSGRGILGKIFGFLSFSRDHSHSKYSHSNSRKYRGKRHSSWS